MYSERTVARIPSHSCTKVHLTSASHLANERGKCHFALLICPAFGWAGSLVNGSCPHCSCSCSRKPRSIRSAAWLQLLFIANLGCSFFMPALEAPLAPKLPILEAPLAAFTLRLLRHTAPGHFQTRPPLPCPFGSSSHLSVTRSSTELASRPSEAGGRGASPWRPMIHGRLHSTMASPAPVPCRPPWLTLRKRPAASR